MMLLLVVGISLYFVWDYLPSRTRKIAEGTGSSVIKVSNQWSDKVRNFFSSVKGKLMPKNRAKDFKTWANTYSLEQQESHFQNFGEDVAELVAWLNTLKDKELDAFVKRVNTAARASKSNLGDLLKSAAPAELKRITEYTFLTYAVADWKASVKQDQKQPVQVVETDQPESARVDAGEADSAQSSRSRSKGRTRTAPETQTAEATA